MSIGFVNLQSPISLTVAENAESFAIYGRIYKSGVTEPAGAPTGIIAQLGYGPSGSDPTTSNVWTWVDATYGSQNGNDDEFAGTLTITVAGTYAYTYRFSDDGGTTWVYADSDGNGINAGLSFDSTKLGTLTVTGINDAPTGTSKTITIDEDQVYTFSAADFGYVDEENDTFASVRIDTVPMNGVLLLNGNTVFANDVISAGDIANLVYDPPPDENGVSYASFSFSVFDGTDYAVSPALMTFDITAVNDAPSGTSASFFGPAMDDVQTGQVSGYDNEAPSLTFAVVPGSAVGGTVTAFDVDTGSFTFTPFERFLGLASFQFTVNDGELTSAASPVEIFYTPPNYTAGPIALGAATTANTTTAGAQVDPTVAVLTGGGHVIVWTTPDADDTGIRGQVFTTAGAKSGVEFAVNTSTSGAQNQANIAALFNGGFVVTWTDGTDGINGQRFTATGAKSGVEFQIDSGNGDGVRYSSVTGLTGGGFVVTWESDGQDGDGYGIYARRYDASGVAVGGEFLINNDTQFRQISSSVEATADGGFMVTWQNKLDNNVPGNFTLLGQKFSANGTEQGNEFEITNTLAAAPATAQLADGSYVIVWTGATSIQARHFNANGVAIDSASQVNTTGGGFRYPPAIVALNDGGYFIAWASDRDGGGTGNGIGVSGQRYNAFGQKVGGEFHLNTLAADDQGNVRFDPTVLNVAAWSSHWLDVTADGRLVATWTDTSSGDVVQRLFNLPWQRIGNANANTLIGGAESDDLYGAGGADILRGLAKADRLFGDSGNDTLNGGLGADQLNGGANVDTASYENATAGVVANLFNRLLNTGEAAGDVYTGIENLKGSNLNDSLTGNGGSNILLGLNGNDILNPGTAGVDRLEGGLSNDTYVLGNRVVSAAQVTIVDTGGIDTVTSTISRSIAALGTIENLALLGAAAISLNGTGNNLGNVITGHAGTNALSGGNGNDTLVGGLGNDSLVGGLNNDVFVFNTALNSTTNRDFVVDFNVTNDSIRLENAIFTGLVQATSAVGVTMLSKYFTKNATGAATSADHRIIYETDTGLLRYDANGSAAGGAGPIIFADLASNLLMTNADFLVI